MIRLIIKRCLAAIPLLMLLSICTFCLLNLLPGDAVDVLIRSAEKDMSFQDKELIRHEFGLDRHYQTNIFACKKNWRTGTDAY